MWRRLNPFAEMDALRREIDRVFEGYGGRGQRPFRYAFLPGSAARAYPLMNVSEDAEAVYVEALAPGVDPETLDVSLERNVLTISGEKKSLRGVNPDAYHRSERATGRFVRTLRLDSEVDDGKIGAEYANGLLLITLPKAETAKPRQITVTVK